ncbi:MAG TPA: MFS transporter [Planctomycetota bacterium]|nr:MFS transporter [Planctomycetota bacterium]
MSDGTPTRSKAWRWGVCVLLLAATTINYMDRLTLSTTAKRVKTEFTLDNAQYGKIETSFSLAFAAGSMVFGILADRVSLRLLYPVVLILWSATGFATGLVRSYSGLIVCRTLLGLFEAGHWPCALRTVQRILEPKDRAMGNGLLQSGASLGAVITPFIVQPFLDRELGWRLPFMVIGAVGALWSLVWFVLIRSDDLQGDPSTTPASSMGFLEAVLSRRFLALVLMLSLINTAWQLLRAWLPLFLREGRGYDEAYANYFTVPYYLATDLGALAAGALALRMTRRGETVHGARLRVFVGMAMLAALTNAAVFMPRGLPLLGTLLIVGFGALGVFPCYYSFAQEISERHVGKVNGLLSVCGWIVTGGFQWLFGAVVDARNSFDLPMALVGWAPLAALVLFVALWTRDPVERRTA